MVRLSVIIFCTFMFLSTILISGFEILNRLKVAPSLAVLHATQSEYLEDFLKDQADLTLLPLFTEKFSTQSDAGPLLNSMFAWSPGFDGEDFVPAAGTPLQLKARYREAAIRYGKDWMNHHSWFNQEEFDFKIFEQIRGYDHWDVEANSPIEQVGVNHPYLNGIELPMPDITDFMILSQIYLMKAVDNNQHQQALKDVRHLARLLLSTESMPLEMAGLRLLDHERTAYNYYVKAKLMKDSDWEPLPATALLQATRAWPATAGYLKLVTQDAVFKKVFLDTKPVGFCAAINTSVPHDWLLKPMLYPRVWPEASFSDQYNRHLELINNAKTHCRMKYLSRLIEAGESYNRLPVPALFKYLPFSRRTYGMKLATVGFGGFAIYADPFARQRDPSSQNVE